MTYATSYATSPDIQKDIGKKYRPRDYEAAFRAVIG